MGADIALIKAAGLTGPKRVDYSGIFTGLSKLATAWGAKNRAANILIDKAEDLGVAIEEFPEGMRTDENVDVFNEAKTKYAEAAQLYKRTLSPKRRREAVKEMNRISSGVQRLKSDMTKFSEYKANVWNNKKNLSGSVSTADEDWFNSLILEDGKLNASVNFDLDKGLTLTGTGGRTVHVDELTRPVLSSDSLEMKADVYALIDKYTKEKRRSGSKANELELNRNISLILEKYKAADGGFDILKSFIHDVKLDIDDNGVSKNISYTDDVFNTLGYEKKYDEFLKHYEDVITEEEKKDMQNVFKKEMMAQEDPYLQSDAIADYIARSVNHNVDQTEYTPPSNGIRDIRGRDTLPVNYGVGYITTVSANDFHKSIQNKDEIIQSPNGSYFKFVDGQYWSMNDKNEAGPKAEGSKLASNQFLLMDAGIWNQGYKLDNYKGAGGEEGEATPVFEPPFKGKKKKLSAFEKQQKEMMEVMDMDISKEEKDKKLKEIQKKYK